MKYTQITRTEKANGTKNYWVRISLAEFQGQCSTIWGMVDHYFNVSYFWYNGKRQMNDSKGFRTIEDAQKFYEKKIKDLEVKIS